MAACAHPAAPMLAQSPRRLAPVALPASTRRFITRDDPQSLAAKAAWAKSRHLGGIMYWEQGLDPSGELLDVLWRGLQPTPAPPPH